MRSSKLMARDKVKRAFIWIRSALRIIDRTTLPGEILGEIRPILDTFGWDRLREATELGTTFTAAPGVSTTGAVTPDDVLRVYVAGAVRHTDVGVNHFLWIEKVLRDTSQVIELTPPTLAVPVDVPQCLTRWIVVEPGARLRGVTDLALVAGAIALNLNFIDLPFGEYIPPV